VLVKTNTAHNACSIYKAITVPTLMNLSQVTDYFGDKGFLANDGLGRMTRNRGILCHRLSKGDKKCHL